MTIWVIKLLNIYEERQRAVYEKRLRYESTARRKIKRLEIKIHASLPSDRRRGREVYVNFKIASERQKETFSFVNPVTNPDVYRI